VRDSVDVDALGGCLTVIGDLVEDVVVWTEAPVQRGTDNAAIVHRTRGGSAANTAILAAAEIPTRFIGQVGDDPVGDALCATLTAAGVDSRIRRRGRTGTVVVLVDIDGERTMFPDRAASAALGPIDPDWLSGTAIVHVPAYGLATEPMASAILDAVAVVRSTGGAVSVDLSAASLLRAPGGAQVWERIAQMAPEVVFANDDEALAADLSGRVPWEVFVIKRGPDPARILRRVGAAVTTLEVPAPRVLVARDTTGAGDAFAAGYLAAWLCGAEPEEATRAGHRRAAEVLDAPGAL